MTLQRYTDSLSKEKQINLAVLFIKLALPIWDNYAKTNELSYCDSVVGMKHTVDKKLLLKTLNIIEEQIKSSTLKNKLLELSNEFIDPVVALQDMDWELPDEVLKTFYSVYNLLDSMLGKEKTVFNESTVYVSINQAIDALETSKMFTFEEIDAMLEKNRALL